MFHRKDSEQTRSFCYVDDVVEGMLRMMSQDEEVGPVNLGNPNEFTIRELAEQVLDLTGSTSPIVHQPLPQDDPTRRCPDITRAKQLLEWEPKVQLREGLQNTIAYFEQLLSKGDLDRVSMRKSQG